MFLIGEFARIGQVSTAQLRRYDRMGLLQPQKVDSMTGYRYYSATQLPQLNRILALKELGLTLEQIGRALNENISSEELRGMLFDLDLRRPSIYKLFGATPPASWPIACIFWR